MGIHRSLESPRAYGWGSRMSTEGQGPAALALLVTWSTLSSLWFRISEEVSKTTAKCSAPTRPDPARRPGPDGCILPLGGLYPFTLPGIDLSVPGPVTQRLP